METKTLVQWNSEDPITSTGHETENATVISRPSGLINIQKNQDKEDMDVNEDPIQEEGNVFGVVLDSIDVSPTKHQLAIEYEELTESSYSEITIRSLSSSLRQCYWDKSLSDPFIRDEGFTITSIRKNDTCYLERDFSALCDSQSEESSRSAIIFSVLG